VASADAEILHVHEIVDLEEPADWLTGQDRDSVSGDEGREVRLVAFLKIVKTETSGETCNCNLHSLANTDLHLVMVDHQTDSERESVTAEITPRVRKLHHPSWTAQKIGALQGKFVRLTGWLMLDTSHLHHSKKVNEKDHAGIPLKRATNWKLHPVTSLEVCTTTITKCRQGTGWKNVN
jgi:hypothetical protein